MAEARARDLREVVEANRGGLHSAVTRVNLAAASGAGLIRERLEQLSDEVGLIRPTDPAALAAEREISTSLRRGTTADLIAFCRQKIADYKAPRGVTFWDGPLPLSPTNKIDKKAIRTAVLAARDTGDQA